MDGQITNSIIPITIITPSVIIPMTGKFYNRTNSLYIANGYLSSTRRIAYISQMAICLIPEE